MVGFSLSLDDLVPDVRCVTCKRARELPADDRPRLPSRMAGLLTVSTDEPCPQCGSTRVSIELSFEDEGDDDDD